MSTTATLTPTRRPGLRAALDRAIDRLQGARLLSRPAPIAGAVALLAACAAGVLVALGAPADVLSAVAAGGAFGG